MERPSGVAPPLSPGAVTRSHGLDGSPLGIAIGSAPEGVHVIELVGELDLGTIPKLEPRLFKALRAHDAVVMDLSRLSFIDSSGIGLLIEAHRAGNGRRKLHTIVSPGSQAARVFAIAGIDRVLRIFFDRDQAISPLARRPGSKGRRAA